MKAKTIQNMQYFAGKVCSIFLPPLNRSFEELKAREHFVVRVQEINEDGLWGTHPYNPQMISFFSMAHIVSIQEEIELDPANPEHAKMIKEFEETHKQKLESDMKPQASCACDAPASIPEAPPLQEGEATFVDIEELTRLAMQTKKAYDALG